MCTSRPKRASMLQVNFHGMMIQIQNHIILVCDMYMLEKLLVKI